MKHEENKKHPMTKNLDRLHTIVVADLLHFLQPLDLSSHRTITTTFTTAIQTIYITLEIFIYI